ncbi:unnamed protein product [Paramecium primaurelia]|uniref:Uncharacterized protein n=1 Tax=Paramecium primaurelia TaxID=5886 RepID=A0A8S1KBL1_PARPR|nr:unnamed protein product [Paramecium primaurelia]
MDLGSDHIKTSEQDRKTNQGQHDNCNYQKQQILKPDYEAMNYYDNEHFVIYGVIFVQQFYFYFMDIKLFAETTKFSI